MPNAGYIDDERRCPECGVSMAERRSNARHCSRLCRERANAKRAAEARGTRLCDKCGTRFAPKSTLNRFCSRSCEKASHAPKARSRICPECGGPVTRDLKAIYCSKACTTRRNMRRRRELYKLHGLPSVTGRTMEALEYEAILRHDPCCYCGALGTHMDHIVPRSRGGSEYWDNLTAACAECNNCKGPRSLLEWMALHRMRSEWGLWVDIALGKRAGFPVRREHPHAHV